PLAGPDRALDVDLRALLQVLADDLRELRVEHHVVPLGALLRLTGLLVLPVLRRRAGDGGDRAAGRQVARRRVLAEIADEDDLVDCARHDFSPEVSVTSAPSARA